MNIERGLAEHSTKIIAISDKQKQELSEEFTIAPADKFEVIPLGFDLQRFQMNYQEKRLAFRKKYLIEDDEIAIGIVGRLTSVKNHHLFINAIERVKQKTTKKIRAFVIGDGELRNDLLQLAGSKNLQTIFSDNGSYQKSFFTFTSWIKDIDSAYPGLDIVAMTSLNEGTPVSLIEAQAANKPIVTTNVGGIENIVIPEKTALLTKNNCIDDFSEKLLRLIEDDRLRDEQAKYGWTHVKEKFHYTRLVSDMEHLYEKLLKS